MPFARLQTAAHHAPPKYCQHRSEGLRARGAVERCLDIWPLRRLAGPAARPGVQHTVEFGKYLFATLDDADPKSREKGLQEGWRKATALGRRGLWEVIAAAFCRRRLSLRTVGHV